MVTQTTSFTYTISDGVGTDTATVNVTIEDISPAALAADEGPMNVTSGNILFADVLANDSPSGVELDVLVAPNPTKGTAVIESGQIKYTPRSGETGADSVGYRIKNTANNTTDVGVLSIQINAAAPSGVFTWGYPFPRADAVDSTKVRMWTIGTGYPSGYATGDILIANFANPAAIQTGRNFNISGLKGPLVLCGMTINPTGALHGNPYSADWVGADYIFKVNFASTAKAHASWEHENNKSIDWPFVFYCNCQIDYSVNNCNFGDMMRIDIAGSQTLDASKQLRGPQSAAFWNKIFLKRGPHYADDEVNSSGTVLQNAAFHSDGIQVFGSTPVIRWANCYLDWIMGQCFFCGRQAEDWGFPRTTRTKFKNCAWVHNVPWKTLPGGYHPQDGAPSTTLWDSPKMVMNGEQGFGTKPPFEVSDYGSGKYWAALFEGQCYIKRIATHTSLNVNRFLAPQDGITGRDASGNYQFATAVQSTHTYPAWAGNLRLLGTGTDAPSVLDTSHVGLAHRLTTVNAFMTAIGR